MPSLFFKALDVALEALKETLRVPGGQSGRAERVNIDELWRYAQLDRVAKVMRPYLESLV